MSETPAEGPPKFVPFIDAPGIYDLPELAYHSDPVAPAPSLSRSIAKLLIEASPAHAYAQHPRLGGSAPAGPAAGDDDMDVGTAAHALFLQGEITAVHIPFDSYRTNAAKELREMALADHKIPLKTKQFDAAMRVVDALEAFRARTSLFTDGKPEQTVIWNEGNHWGRCRIDWLPNDPAAPLLDLKTTGNLATPGGWGRTCFQFGADMQAAMYPRGVEFVRGEAPDGMLFIVAETKPPYAIRVFGLDPVAVEVGEAKAAAARAVWVQCMAEHRRRVEFGQPAAAAWPGYPPETEWIFPPPWIVRQWEEARVGGIGRALDDPGLIERMVRAGNMGG
jgi:hypothetical protein